MLRTCLFQATEIHKNSKTSISKKWLKIEETNVNFDERPSNYFLLIKKKAREG